MSTHDVWRYLHILLFVFWLGADVGVYTAMVFIKNARLPMATRLTLINLGFVVDVFPRVSFALFIPVGVTLTANLGLYPVTIPMAIAAWIMGLAWAAMHITIYAAKGTPLSRVLQKGNIWFEAVAGLGFVGFGALSAVTGAPAAETWFGVKMLLFGLLFWITLGIDTAFKPFTMLIRMAKDGVTPEGEGRLSSRRTSPWCGR